jgi:hypothetical protein
MNDDTHVTFSPRDQDAEERQAITEQIRRNQAAIELLRSWRDGDAEEQRETWEYLRRALDEDRLSDRKFFP